MSLAYLKVIKKDGDYSLVDFIPITPVEGVPPRPRPEPPLVDPDYGIDIDTGYPGNPKPPEVPEGKLVYLFAPPAGETPPTAPGPQAEVAKVKYGDGGTGWAWLDPHIAPTK